jgi:LmbE family N-acetylglucosaminyl deacetylase
MCITAHPDDEAGAFGGALLMAKASGVMTSVVCLTAGAAGSYRANGQSDAELAETRRQEFIAACDSLGVRHAVILNYPDGRLHLEPFQPMVGELVAHLRRERPHVVISFGSDGGMNLHRDHTMISLAATAAFHWAGRSSFYPEQLTGATTPWAPQKLYYSATRFISTRDEEAAGAGARVPASLTLDLEDWKERKVEAFLEHRSQRGVLERVRAEFEDSMDEEAYLLVAARNPVYPDDALFAGVIED